MNKALLKVLRKYRRRFFKWQIILGDVIALLKGQYIERVIKKKMRKEVNKRLPKAMATRRK